MPKAKKWLSRVAEKLRPAPASPPFAIGADLNALVAFSIMGYPDVKEVTFNEHEEGEISLELKVGTTIPVGAAVRLGDNAVRMAKSFLEPGTVGKQVGKGKRDYGISVYRPDGEPIAKGRKSKGSKDIRWPRKWLPGSEPEG